MLDLNNREKLKREIIVHDHDCELYLNKFLRYVVNTFEIEGDIRFNVAMIKHWMWQTKRYVLGLSVKSPIFVNFYGEDQETGKTKFIEQLTRNLKDYRVGITLSDMLDDRKAEVWTKNYVTVADEMKLGDVAGKQLGQIIAVIKNYLTATQIEYRELGTHKIVKADRTFSPIASSNKSICDVIFDETGMRRFYEFVVKAKKNRDQAYKRVENFINAEIEEIWQGIDATLEDGYVSRHNEFGQMLEDIQNTYKHLDYVDIFLKDEESYYYNMISLDKEFRYDVNRICKHLEIVKSASKFSIVGIQMIDVISFTKEVKNWVKDIDYGSEKYIPSAMTMPAKLEKKGKFVTEFQGKHYIFIRN
jgi:hypothetical protein